MTDEEIRAAHEHQLWDAFCEWAPDNGVDPDDHPDDWGPWWQCFAAGAQAQHDATWPPSRGRRSL